MLLLLFEHVQTNSQSKERPNVITTQGDLDKALEYMHSLLNGTIHGGVILEKIAGPRSSGYLHLSTLDPNDNPAVRFNYFQDPDDLKTCVMGMQTIIKVIESEPFSKFRVPGMTIQSLINVVVNFPLNLRPRHFSTALSLEQFCIDTVLSIWHYHGGCQVNKVVDKDYKVLGAVGLRVVDGSTFYESPGTNPQATVMMLGRYVDLFTLLSSKDGCGPGRAETRFPTRHKKSGRAVHENTAWTEARCPTGTKSPICERKNMARPEYGKEHGPTRARSHGSGQALAETTASRPKWAEPRQAQSAFCGPGWSRSETSKHGPGPHAIRRAGPSYLSLILLNLACLVVLGLGRIFL